MCGERFRAAKKPPEELACLAIEFFSTGLSGLATYDGLSMPEAHTGTGITNADYVAVLDDILRRPSDACSRVIAKPGLKAVALLRGGLGAWDAARLPLVGKTSSPY